ncbi:alpha/beta fold hydrolase [Paraglaciecola arctica]|uniref:alpha/beta fold hydrolase n=1 Tax=Paraglaciecola arctica TaxID=1128911 RepID=UPI001C06C074|nr:alpha/beta fold hydrolase [Paraglaciecola arctica]MBU3004634.1 alpha/beta fold hydrolase [Paraglaciecola arctica]
MSKIEFEGFGGVTLRGDTYGDKEHPGVLLLPGAMQTRQVWKQAAKELANAGRYVVTIDLRGHGDSDKAADGNYGIDTFINDLVAVLSQFSSRPTIVGSNLGGWAAITAIGEADNQLATGLVLTNPPGPIQPHNIQYLTDAINLNSSEFRNNKDVDPNVMQLVFDLKSFEKRLRSAAATISIPTLIVRGADSEISSKDSAKEFSDMIRDAEVSEIHGAGHYVAFDKADEFNATLLEFLERRLPHKAPEYVTGSDPRTLRDAMGCFATGITVVTTKDPSGMPVGLTANSFTSVSLDPPLVLICLGKNVGSLQAFLKAKVFAVNILHMGQQPVSNLFASKGVDRFNNTDWETWEHDVPIIKHSLASFECIKHSEIEQGDHVIVIGEVVRAKYESRRDPLLYFGGKYRRLHFT